jgi:hypothetical protein
MLLSLVLAATTTMLDGAHIYNSGSTNTPAYEILVWSDGHARVIAKGAARNLRIDPNVAKTFFADAKQAKRERAPTARCMKSASFGSTTTVLYHGWRSPDLSCPTMGALAALASDVNVISQVLQPQRPRRITLPPNEPRRFPSEGPTPSPTPKV